MIKMKFGLFGRQCFGETDDFIPFVPLPALFEHFHPLEALEHVPLNDDLTRSAKTFVLRHKSVEVRERDERRKLFSA